MSDKPMKLASLEIKSDWSSKGQLYGTVWFDGSITSTRLKITPELTQRILDLCADALLDAAKEAADIMRSDIIESMNNPDLALPKPKKGFFK